MKTDVVVIGAGLAGMVAALAAHEGGAEVLLLDRGPAGRGTNSALSNGVFAGPTLSYDPDDYINDTVETGRHLNRLSYVKQIAREAPRAFQFLRAAGIDLALSANTCSVNSPVSGMIPGVTLVDCFRQRLRDAERIYIKNGYYVTDILRRDDRVSGVIAFDRAGREEKIKASAVVMACGGAGAIYRRNDNQKRILGQGYHLAAKAGLALRDMEFVQFYPIVIDEPGLPSVMIYPPYPRVVKILSASGENILVKCGLEDLNDAIRKKRDTFSALLLAESRSSDVFLDLRDVPENRWERHPLVLLRKIRFDFHHRPVRISPAAHFFIGGVDIDESGQTALAGLFACGEMVWGFHGANRMGGNALTECVVSGLLTGNSATRYALSVGQIPSHQSQILEAPYPAGGSSTKINLRAMLRRVRVAAWEWGGVVRSADGLSAGLQEVDNIRRQVCQAAVDTLSEKRLRMDLLSALFVLKALLKASVGRLESRGCFIRSDFPLENDADWLRNSRLSYDQTEDDFTVSYELVKQA
jgi:succinate dehydrogenase/fumarate reductase flavoprotein subunit